MGDRPIALDAYEALADAYAAALDRKPHNAYYERPATLSLLPDVRGKRVLDAGCGPGLYAAWLLDHGASVTAIDASPRMLALAAERTGGRATLQLADLARPLDFLPDGTIDIVLSPLVLEYVEDWRAVFGEFHRVLVGGGTLVVSVTHPMFDVSYYSSSSYFETESVSCEWRGFGLPVRMPSYRRSLAETLNPITEAGFVIERLLEPKPTEQFRHADPRHYEELMRQPCFLCIRARKSR